MASCEILIFNPLYINSVGRLCKVLADYTCSDRLKDVVFFGSLPVLGCWFPVLMDVYTHHDLWTLVRLSASLGICVLLAFCPACGGHQPAKVLPGQPEMTPAQRVDNEVFLSIVDDSRPFEGHFPHQPSLSNTKQTEFEERRR